MKRPFRLPRVRFRRGEVVLAGAGPGDRDLTTVRALAYLRQADVVVHDRLVDPRALDWVRPSAEIVDAGKERGGPVRQQERIHRLLVSRARRGLRVIRWKGGDPFVYGRGFEEVRHLESKGIPVTVVPGVSSVHGALSTAGIPIVLRGEARTYAVFSGHEAKGGGTLVPSLAGLAQSADTLVGLMVVGTLDRVVAELLRVRSPDEPAAIVQEGASARQSILRGPLKEIVALASRARLRPPAILVVGAVARHAGRPGYVRARSVPGALPALSPQVRRKRVALAVEGRRSHGTDDRSGRSLPRRSGEVAARTAPALRKRGWS